MNTTSWSRLKSFLSTKRTIVAVGCFLFLALVGVRYGFRDAIYRWRTNVHEVAIPGAVIAYRDLGQGSPTVVIVNGMACTMYGYYPLQKSLANLTRVINYDRPGLGLSPPNAANRTLDVIDQDLKSLLQALAAPPPYILIGHSLGGAIIRHFADRHPGEVAGLVFLDHPHEDWFRYIRNTWSPKEVEDYFKWWSRENPGFVGVSQEEMLNYEANCDMIRGVKIPSDVPVLMFTGNNAGHFRKSSPGKTVDRDQWAAMQGLLIEGVKDAKHIVDWEAGHMLHKDKPQMVEAEIQSFIARTRTKGVLQPSNAPR